ncbi:hypothetical protein HJG60_009839 [Phyllostomus discolor]|uniref:Uncharacterized protein n=1 Tax=Phyllostomus discolor TaxID=89673 RepID=A0A834B6W3_9CHIR|nr:hypothetical protein HJG60_009839 [Phyllostomus discolor]
MNRDTSLLFQIIRIQSLHSGNITVLNQIPPIVLIMSLMTFSFSLGPSQTSCTAFNCHVPVVSFYLEHFHTCLLLFFKVFYLFISTEREREGNISVWLTVTPPTGDLAHNPGICPDWESNRRPFRLQAGTHSTEPHQPGPYSF